jgi:hypothetical protein
MRKIFILPITLLLVITITSCKKSSSGSVSGAITANIDGTPTSFNTEAQAVLTNAGGVYEVSIIGFQGAVSTSNQIGIAVAGTSPITAGTYGDNPSSNAPDDVSLTYTQQPGGYLYGASGTSPDTASVTITSISSTEVVGTFTGGMVLISGSTGTNSHTVTNGKFDVKFN